jgi:hypothetical protein
MKRLICIIGAISALLVFIIPVAYASTNAGQLSNVHGHSIGYDCSLSGDPLRFHRDGWLYDSNSGWRWNSPCADTDGARFDRDNRCFHADSLAFPWKDGWYRVNGNNAIKIPGTTTFLVYPASSCNGHHWRWAGDHFRRI